MKGEMLPTIMLDELAACSRDNCRITPARAGVDNLIASHAALLECSHSHSGWPTTW